MARHCHDASRLAASPHVRVDAAKDLHDLRGHRGYQERMAADHRCGLGTLAATCSLKMISASFLMEFADPSVGVTLNHF